MKPLTVLLTASGYMGGNSLCENLRNNGEREIKVIGTDMNPNSAARFYCDKFYPTPAGHDQEYIPRILDICRRDKPDILLPASSSEVYYLTFHRPEIEAMGTKVMISSTASLEVSLDKFKTYHYLDGKIPLPKYFLSREGFVSKPVEGKGGRGVQMFGHTEEPTLVMEKMSGEEIDADVLSFNREVLLCVFKIRTRTYGGILVEGQVVNRPYLEQQISKIIQTIPIQYLSVFQFIGGKLLELNPRIAGAVPYFDGWNMPYLAIKLALGEITSEEVKAYRNKVPFGLKMTRYLSQIHYD